MAGLLKLENNDGLWIFCLIPGNHTGPSFVYTFIDSQYRRKGHFPLKLAEKLSMIRVIFSECMNSTWGPKMDSRGFLFAFALCLSSAVMCSVLVLVTISTLLAPNTCVSDISSSLFGGSPMVTLQSMPLTVSVRSPPQPKRPLLARWKLMLSVSRKVWMSGVDSRCCTWRQGAQPS